LLTIRLSTICGMEWWNAILEWNTGMAYYHNANDKVIIANVEF